MIILAFFSLAWSKPNAVTVQKLEPVQVVILVVENIANPISVPFAIEKNGTCPSGYSSSGQYVR